MKAFSPFVCLAMTLSLSIAAAPMALAQKGRTVKKAESKRSHEDRKRTVAILIHDGVELLDFSGPGEVFAAAEGFEVYTVASSEKPIMSQGFVKVVPEHTFDSAPKADIIVLPGGKTNIPLADAKVMAWLRETGNEAEVVMSVCTGAFLLAEVGMLDGAKATTWHGAIDSLRKAAPKTEILENTRFVDNGAIVTTAGVSAGIDGALHIVSRFRGKAAAAKTARYMEYDKWQPDDGTIVPGKRARKGASQ